MGTNKRKKRRLDREKKLERMVLKTYYDFSNPGSYGGFERLRKATGVSMKKLKATMQKSLIYTLHKPVRRRYTTNPTIANSIDHQWAADLADVKNLSRYNKGINYLLTVVDILSKFAWVVPLKNKTGTEQKRGFDFILRQGTQPLRLQTDKGSEFYNKTFQDYLKQKGITHLSTESDTKASVGERFNRFIKQRLYRALTANNTLKYLDFLPGLVKGYNAAVYRSIRIAPKDVNFYNNCRIWKRVYGDKLYGKKKNKKVRKHRLNVGDKVMLSKVRKTFKREYLPGWTEEIFIVDNK